MHLKIFHSKNNMAYDIESIIKKCRKLKIPGSPYFVFKLKVINASSIITLCVILFFNSKIPGRFIFTGISTIGKKGVKLGLKKFNKNNPTERSRKKAPTIKVSPSIRYIKLIIFLLLIFWFFILMHFD